jgi:hypothetical protein
VAQVFGSPNPPPDTGVLKDVALWRLSRPLRLTNSPSNYSIAERIWRGTEADFLDKSLTVYGIAATFPTLRKGTFKVVNVSHKYDYELRGVDGVVLQSGDSGGPGWASHEGFDYLLGTTHTGGPRGGQADLPEVRGWIDDTLFDQPRVIEFDANGYSLALTAAGAHAAYRSGATIKVTTCAQEPCAAGVGWGAPEVVATDAISNPVIIDDGMGPTIFVRRAVDNAVWTRGKAFGSWGAWQSLGGDCREAPAAYRRPGGDSVAPLVDVFCRGSDSLLYHNYRLSGQWSGWGSIGAPPAGLRAGSSPVVVANDADTIQVFAVGADGAAWLRTGSGRLGWFGWASLGGANVTGVAAASYDPSRIDAFVMTSQGALFHKVFDGTGWWPAWNHITRGGWEGDKPPFAAAFSGHKGRMSAGGHQGGAAHIQRYSDW